MRTTGLVSDRKIGEPKCNPLTCYNVFDIAQPARRLVTTGVPWEFHADRSL